MLGPDAVRDALEASGTGAWSWDLASGAVWWSAEMCALYGRHPRAARTTREDFLETVFEPDRAAVSAAERAVLGGEHGSSAPTEFRVEHRVRWPDGQLRWVELRGSLRDDEGGRRLTGVAVDCTARRAAEAERRERDEAWRVYADLASDYVYVVEFGEEAPVPTVVAGSFERTTGMTLEEVAARGGWVEVLHPEDRESAGAVVETLLRGQPAIMEYRIIDPEGQVRWLRDRARPVIDQATGRVTHLRGAVQEITEQRRLEEQLVNARKHEALARFSGGVAHDFNNMLTVVLGAEEIVRRGAPSEEAREALDVIHSAVSHAADLIRGMLLFARQSVGTPQVFGLSELVTEQLPVLRKGLAPGQSLHVELTDEPAHVRIDASYAQLMLLNLVVNARHASSDAGSVWLRTEVVRVDADSSAPPELEPGSFARITVRDEGIGIAPDVLPRIFEPYYTTRAPGVGTGLGLSACQGVATRAGGVIDVSSALGRGATFRVYLPLVEPSDRPIAAGSRLRLSEGGTETVLLVDDEPMLRRVFGRALRDRGYDVELAASAEEALERLEERGFDLVVSDIVMPGAGGLALAAAVRERWPETAVLLMSGNTDARSHAFPFLAKPMSSGGLARRIRELLDGPQPAE